MSDNTVAILKMIDDTQVYINIGPDGELLDEAGNPFELPEGVTYHRATGTLMYDGHVVATITRYSNNFGSGQAENTTNELLGAGQQVTGGSNSESGNTNGATGGAEQSSGGAQNSAGGHGAFGMITANLTDGGAGGQGGEGGGSGGNGRGGAGANGLTPAILTWDTDFYSEDNNPNDFDPSTYYNGLTGPNASRYNGAGTAPQYPVPPGNGMAGTLGTILASSLPALLGMMAKGGGGAAAKAGGAAAGHLPGGTTTTVPKTLPGWRAAMYNFGQKWYGQIAGWAGVGVSAFFLGKSMYSLGKDGFSGGALASAIASGAGFLVSWYWILGMSGPWGWIILGIIAAVSFLFGLGEKTDREQDLNDPVRLANVRVGNTYDSSAPSSSGSFPTWAATLADAGGNVFMMLAAVTSLGIGIDLTSPSVLRDSIPIAASQIPGVRDQLVAATRDQDKPYIPNDIVGSIFVKEINPDLAKVVYVVNKSGGKASVEMRSLNAEGKLVGSRDPNLSRIPFFRIDPRTYKITPVEEAEVALGSQEALLNAANSPNVSPENRMGATHRAGEEGRELYRE